MKYIQFAFISLFLSLAHPVAAANSNADTTAQPTNMEANSLQRVVFYNYTFAPAVRSLFADVMERLMQLTVPDFGPFEITYYDQYSNGTRMMQLVGSGDAVQVFFSAPLAGFESAPNVAHVHVPFVSAILGLRVVTVQRSRASLFDNVNDRDTLAKLRIGLGYNWADTSVFQHNLLPYGEAVESKSLLPMLSKGRFDYISASVLDNQRYNDDDFVTLDNPLIYYPVPIYMHISEQHPTLVKRLTIGMERFIQQGEATQLIQQRLEEISSLQKDTPYDVIVLSNPLYSPEQNQASVAELKTLLPAGVTIHLHR